MHGDLRVDGEHSLTAVSAFLSYGVRGPMAAGVWACGDELTSILQFESFSLMRSEPQDMPIVQAECRSRDSVANSKAEVWTLLYNTASSKIPYYIIFRSDGSPHPAYDIHIHIHKRKRQGRG